jgi:hypothetical protein
MLARMNYHQDQLRKRNDKRNERVTMGCQFNDVGALTECLTMRCQFMIRELIHIGWIRCVMTQRK